MPDPTKTTDLPAITSLSGDEVFYIVDDDDGSPVSRKITLENLLTAYAARPELTGVFVPKVGTSATAATDILTSKVTADTQDRFVIDADGTIRWSSGAAVSDVSLARTGTRELGISGKLKVTSANASDRGIVIQGAQFQVGSMSEWLAFGGQLLAQVRADGEIETAEGYRGRTLQHPDLSSALLTLVSGAEVLVTSRTAAGVGLAVKGAAAQTANLQEWRNNAGTVLGAFSSDGNIVLSGVAGTFVAGAAGAIGWSSSWFDRDITTGEIRLILQNYSGAGMRIYTGNAGATPFAIKGAAVQTATLQEWRNSSDAALAWVGSDGSLATPQVYTPIVNGLAPTGAGLKLASAATDKLGFYGATAVVQPTNVANPAGGATIDAEARTAIDAILSRLETLGLFAA